MDFRGSVARGNLVNERFSRGAYFFEISVDGARGGEHFRGLSFFHALCVGNGIALLTVFANAPL